MINEKHTFRWSHRLLFCPLFPTPQTSRLIHLTTFMPSSGALSRTTIPESAIVSQDAGFVVRKHAKFWDRENKGYITPYDAAIGFMNLGHGVAFSFAVGTFLTVLFSYATNDTWFPDLRGRVQVRNLRRLKQNSSLHDKDGHLDEERFDRAFDRYATRDLNRNTITVHELFRMNNADGQMFTFSVFNALLVWSTIYFMVGHRGVLDRDDVRAAYDGTLFHELRDHNKRITASYNSRKPLHMAGVKPLSSSSYVSKFVVSAAETIVLPFIPAPITRRLSALFPDALEPASRQLQFNRVATPQTARSMSVARRHKTMPLHEGDASLWNTSVRSLRRTAFGEEEPVYALTGVAGYRPPSPEYSDDTHEGTGSEGDGMITLTGVAKTGQTMRDRMSSPALPVVQPPSRDKKQNNNPDTPRSLSGTYLTGITLDSSSLRPEMPSFPGVKTPPTQAGSAPHPDDLVIALTELANDRNGVHIRAARDEQESVYDGIPVTRSGPRHDISDRGMPIGVKTPPAQKNKRHYVFEPVAGLAGVQAHNLERDSMPWGVKTPIMAEQKAEYVFEPVTALAGLRSSGSESENAFTFGVRSPTVKSERKDYKLEPMTTLTGLRRSADELDEPAFGVQPPTIRKTERKQYTFEPMPTLTGLRRSADELDTPALGIPGPIAKTEHNTHAFALSGLRDSGDSDIPLGVKSPVNRGKPKEVYIFEAPVLSGIMPFNDDEAPPRVKTPEHIKAKNPYNYEAPILSAILPLDENDMPSGVKTPKHIKVKEMYSYEPPVLAAVKPLDENDMPSGVKTPTVTDGPKEYVFDSDLSLSCLHPLSEDDMASGVKTPSLPDEPKEYIFETDLSLSCLKPLDLNDIPSGVKEPKRTKSKKKYTYEAPELSGILPLNEREMSSGVKTPKHTKPKEKYIYEAPLLSGIVPLQHEEEIPSGVKTPINILPKEEYIFETLALSGLIPDYTLAVGVKTPPAFTREYVFEEDLSLSGLQPYDHADTASGVKTPKHTKPKEKYIYEPPSLSGILPLDEKDMPSGVKAPKRNKRKKKYVFEAPALSGIVPLHDDDEMPSGVKTPVLPHGPKEYVFDTDLSLSCLRPSSDEDEMLPGVKTPVEIKMKEEYIFEAPKLSGILPLHDDEEMPSGVKTPDIPDGPKEYVFEHDLSLSCLQPPNDDDEIPVGVRTPALVHEHRELVLEELGALTGVLQSDDDESVQTMDLHDDLLRLTGLRAGSLDEEVPPGVKTPAIQVEPKKYTFEKLGPLPDLLPLSKDADEPAGVKTPIVPDGPKQYVFETDLSLSCLQPLDLDDAPSGVKTPNNMTNKKRSYKFEELGPLPGTVPLDEQTDMSSGVKTPANARQHKPVSFDSLVLALSGLAREDDGETPSGVKTPTGQKQDIQFDEHYFDGYPDMAGVLPSGEDVVYPSGVKTPDAPAEPTEPIDYNFSARRDLTCVQKGDVQDSPTGVKTPVQHVKKEPFAFDFDLALTGVNNEYEEQEMSVADSGSSNGDSPVSPKGHTMINKDAMLSKTRGFDEAWAIFADVGQKEE